jgi:hypothetical protein
MNLIWSESIIILTLMAFQTCTIWLPFLNIARKLVAHGPYAGVVVKSLNAGLPVKTRLFLHYHAEIMSVYINTPSEIINTSPRANRCGLHSCV